MRCSSTKINSKNSLPSCDGLSDGTAAGVTMGKSKLIPTGIVDVNNTLFFGGWYTDSLYLSRSDGTAADIFGLWNPATGAKLRIDNYYAQLANAAGVLYLYADNAITGQELWRYDVTGCTTLLASLPLVGRYAPTPTPTSR